MRLTGLAGDWVTTMLWGGQCHDQCVLKWIFVSLYCGCSEVTVGVPACGRVYGYACGCGEVNMTGGGDG